MDFHISTRGNGKKEKTVSIPKNMAEHLIDILSNVECTCVWSERDKEYLKIHDIDKHIVEDLKSAVALSKLANA